MRRPAQTAAQRKHAKEQRALLALRRTAVSYSRASESNGLTLALEFADLTAACDRYRETLSEREQRKLVKR